MVVKDKRGRRRYVAFKLVSEKPVSTDAFMSALKKSSPPGGKPPKLIQFDGNHGIVRCELKDLNNTRVILLKIGEEMGAEIQTLSTSGTLLALRKRLDLKKT
ncbi:MAG: hypothetical protein QW520_04030 [Methanomassiliicoccales archaeon]